MTGHPRNNGGDARPAAPSRQPQAQRWVDKWLAAWGLADCAVCGDCCREVLCCPGCWDGLPWLRHSCRGCRLPLPKVAGPLCAECLRRPPPWRRAAALLAYRPPLAGWLRAAKFAEDPVALHGLSLLMAQLPHSAPWLAEAELLLPLPMPAQRLRQRGLNPAAALARALGRGLDRPCTPGLHCQGLPPPQRGRDRAARQRIDPRRFVAEPAVVGRRLLLVDDVMTTGATLRAASRRLLAAGAAQVDVAVLLRTPAPGD